MKKRVETAMKAVPLLFCYPEILRDSSLCWPLQKVDKEPGNMDCLSQSRSIQKKSIIFLRLLVNPERKEDARKFPVRLLYCPCAAADVKNDSNLSAAAWSAVRRACP